MSEGLRLDGVCILKDGVPLIEVDATVPPGDVLTVMGPSGVGKSTLLAFLTGTLPRGFAGMGRIILNGEDVTDRPAHQRRLGILFQDDLLFPHLSVGENAAFGLAPGGSRADRAARVSEALADVGLSEFEARDPATLSGGQKARVSLVRMLLSEPRALLLDEAFSGLDAALRAQIRGLVFDRARARALPVLMVTHDAEDARAAGGPVFEMEAWRPSAS
ncbi:Spermidine/putrescine import ATP-binding protein PotA [Roseivivax jejudonensis]|uniref:Spermidine/putrescine import ATP-binding protein PotA n=1 Tax=Roseivivax jejudonensis TaxID=1529041 RepID=A0A1X6YKI8_9RHOB|nr:ATP-binding cassette domain-containing protein [Roseivivax jejudonensis]SLN24272.1 Spermidine/putrescine import ATP-binding protein PotA [Roseivivax jejudonensis]